MSILMSVNTFAVNVGANDRLTREATKPYREAYRTATTEQRVQLERDWITGYLEGNLKVTPKQAMAIFNTSRTERSDEEQKSYKRAYAKFLDHVKGEVKKEETAPTSNSRTEKVKAPKAIVSQVIGIVVESGMTKEEFNAFIAEIKSSVTFA